MNRVLLGLVCAVAFALLLVPGAVAQAADDPNTIAACEADANDIPAFEFICPATVALHLRGVFGENTELITWIYLGLVGVALTVWVLVLLWRILPRRYLKLRAKEKVAEVSAGNPATYLLHVENRRKRRPVEVELAITRPPKGWSASLAVEKELPSGFKELLGEDEAMRVPLSARKVGANTATVRVTVKPPTGADPDEWAELDVSAIPYIKDEPRVRRGKEARVVTLVKARAAHAVIQNVTHEPAAFRVKDDVTTTVIVANTGDGDTPPLPIVLEVNGEEVGREVVTIPSGGEACIEFPWIVQTAEARVRVAVQRE